MIWLLVSVVVLIVAAYPPAAIPLLVVAILGAPGFLRWMRNSR